MKDIQTPHWMSHNGTEIRKADCVTVDNSSPGATQVNGFSVHFGVATTGELNNDIGHPYHPSGIYAPPVQSTMGQSGIECVYVFRNDEGYYLGCRDTVNQVKAGTVMPGEFCAYAPGAQGSNKFYLDINGNALLSVQSNITLTAQKNITITSSANNVTIVSSTINLGSSSPTDAVASGMKTDANFQTIITAATAAIAAAVPMDGGKSAFAAFMSALVFPSTASQVVKISG